MCYTLVVPATRFVGWFRKPAFLHVRLDASHATLLPVRLVWVYSSSDSFVSPFICFFDTDILAQPFTNWPSRCSLVCQVLPHPFISISLA